jgi:hypothetical protein
MRDFAFRLSLLILPTTLFGLLAGCGSGSSSLANPHNSAPRSISSAFVKTLNASLQPIQPGMGTPFKVNVKVGDTAIAQNLLVGYPVSAYLPVDAGANREVQISVLEKQPISETIHQTFANDQYYTLITTIADSGPQTTFLQDDLTPPAKGDAKIRMVHEAALAGPIDIYITAPDVTNHGPGTMQPTLSNVPVGSASAYLQIPAGVYTIRVTAAGDPSNVIINALPTDLVAGDIYTGVTLDPHDLCYPDEPACAAVLINYSVVLTQDQPVAGVAPVASGM